MARDEILAWADKHCVHIRSAFVPFSTSRNAADIKFPSLNWKVSLYKDHDPKPTLTIDYNEGSASCPAYKPSRRWEEAQAQRTAIRGECETGQRATRAYYYGRESGWKSDHILGEKGRLVPNLCTFLACLRSDIGVLDYATFEDWCSEFGGNPDSIAARRVYRACLKSATAFRARFGDEAMKELHEACQDY